MIPSGVGGQRPLFGMLSNLPVTTTGGVLIQANQQGGGIPSIQVKQEPMDVCEGNIITADLYLCDSGKGK